MEHVGAAVIVKVNVDIGERDSVRVEESLEQKVIFDGIHLCDAEAICHHASGRRSTSGTHRDAQFAAGHIDEVLHDEEVARETHGLHDVELELYPLLQLGGQRGAIAAFRALVGEFRQVVGLELYAVELVISPEFVNLLLRVLGRQHYIAVLVAGELVKQFLLCDPRAVFLLGAEILGYLEERHDRGVVYRIGLALAENLQCVLQRLRQIGKHLGHLLLRLEPFLLRVAHTVRIHQIIVGGDADEAVMRFGILGVDEVGVVGADDLYAVAAREVDEHGVDPLLLLECLAVGSRDIRAVALQLYVIVVAEHTLEPLHLFLSLLYLARGDKARNLPAKTGRAHYQTFSVGGKSLLVGSGVVIEPVRMGL